MAVRHYISAADGENSVGGAARLKELLAQPGAKRATVDPVKLESVLNNVTGDVRSAINHDWDIDAFDALWFNQTINGVAPPAIPMDDSDKATLVTNAKMLFAYWAWKEGAEAQAMPQVVADDRKAALENLRALGMRLKGWGSQRKPATQRHFKLGQPLTPGHHPAGGHRSKFEGFK